MCLTPIKSYQYEPGSRPYFDVDKFKQQYTYKTGELCPDVSKYELMLPCNNCVECYEHQALEWAYRIMDETKYHENTVALTLTYASNPVGLVKRDLQLFLKRLRKHLEPKRIRYFASGEYGSKKLRPHFHVIIFGYMPDDIKYHHTNDKGKKVFTSKKLCDIWGNGFVSVESISFDRAKYSAKYMQKQLRKFAFDMNLQAPYLTMSLKPGIGLREVPAYKTIDDKLYYGGKTFPLPRYYLKMLERSGVDISDLKKRRVRTAKLRAIRDSSLCFEKNQKFFGNSA